MLTAAERPQGSVIALLGMGNGKFWTRYTYSAYGTPGAAQEAGQPFRYTGRRYDAETGLYYYRARYYSHELGRFLQVDPIGYEDQQNLYAYVGNDPVNNTDPTGEQRKKGTGDKGAQAGAFVRYLIDVFILDTPEEDALERFEESLANLDGKTRRGKKGKLKAKERRAAEQQRSQEAKGGDKQRKGTPRGNKRQNKQFREATRGLPKDKKRQIHEEITGNNSSFEDIKEAAEEIKSE